MAKTAHMSFDFDDWSQLASSDPAAFESRRQQIIDQFILAIPASKRQRLLQLQWRIDQTRQLSSNPVAACIKLSHLMMESVLGENGLLEALRGMDMELDNGATTPAKTGVRRETAKILKFRAL